QKAPAAVQTSEEAFETRVRTLEQQVVDLKERIFRSKSRLLLLQESVAGGEPSTGSRALLLHRNEMSDAFALESVAYALDGAPLLAQTDKDGDLARLEEFEVFNGRIVPGQHQLTVRLVYRGSGFGVFSYLEGYKFRLQYSCTFNAEPGRTATVKVVGFEKGGMTADLKDRPAAECRVELSRDAGDGTVLPAAATTSQSAPAN
ncbi:MAG: dihydrolipoamide acetyltransferase, partial [Myxococcaceae bacterium]|nr:dihydrolipoamide acetyltransferase [Myxococcaceae bacterium]